MTVIYPTRQSNCGCGRTSLDAVTIDYIHDLIARIIVSEPDSGLAIEGIVLSDNTLSSYNVREHVEEISGAYTIDMLSTLYVLTIIGDTTITFSIPATPGVKSVTLFLIQAEGGGHTVDFPAALWSGGAAPTLNVAEGEETDLSFIIRSNGEVRGYLAATDMR